MNRRNSFTIIADILRLCKIPQNKTNIVYRCNLNFNFATPYLDSLEISGCLEKTGKLWRTTQKGLNFLQDYSAFIKVNPIIR